MTAPAKDNDCWNTIGTAGDGSCPRLDTFVHCRNCSVYSEKGRSLLDRPSPDDYLEEWESVLARSKDDESNETISVLIFRLGREWAAVRSAFTQEVVPKRGIHSIPHRTSSVLLGLANIRGELLLCVSLAEILHLGEEEAQKQKSGGAIFGRMVVVAHSGERWVFPVDEVDRIHRVPVSKLEAAPVTISKAASACSKGIFMVGTRRIALLDENLLFDALRRSLHWQVTT